MLMGACVPLLCPLRLHWTTTETHKRAVIDVHAGTGFRLKPRGPEEPIVLENSWSRLLLIGFQSNCCMIGSWL